MRLPWTTRRRRPTPAPASAARSRAPSYCSATSLLAVGCRTTDKNFVWVDTLPESATEGPYLIAPGDTLSVRVFNQEGISGTVRVRSDGMITLLFLGDVEAAARTPVQLAAELQSKLTKFLVNPVVTVALQEARPLEISVLGEVQRAGLYRLEQGAGVLTALAAASGFNDFANRNRIFVVRNGTQRIRFTYAALSQARERAGQVSPAGWRRRRRRVTTHAGPPGTGAPGARGFGRLVSRIPGRRSRRGPCRAGPPGRRRERGLSVPRARATHRAGGMVFDAATGAGLRAAPHAPCR